MTRAQRRRIALALPLAALCLPTAAYALFDPAGPMILAELMAQSTTLTNTIESTKKIRAAVDDTAQVAKRSWAAMQRTAGFVAHPERFLQDSAEAWQSMFPDLTEVRGMLREAALNEGREALGAALNAPGSRVWQEQFLAAASRGEAELQRGLGYVVDALDWADPHARATQLLQDLRGQAQGALHEVSEQFRLHQLEPEQATYVATRAAVMQAALQSHVADVVTHLAQHVDVLFGNAMAATSESLAVQQHVHEQLRDASAAWRARPFVPATSPVALGTP